MSTTIRNAGSAESPHGGYDAENPLPPAVRGATVIPDRVVARIAARVASTALHRLTHQPHAHAALTASGVRTTTYDGTAQLALTVDLPYPTDIAATCGQLQREVAERVAQLTGLDISEVTLTVQRLVVAGRSARVR
ncbi:Asp23/Gls24 family envelope stress response protein [Streptomyces sp. NPDC051956]|uniref:Asp23/Gls24 family envelope stress response protein n=1 Tax=Streptomyces sp. NPDC051956 TaxID=3365677 RepID=UPI0037D90025